MNKAAVKQKLEAIDNQLKNTNLSGNLENFENDDGKIVIEDGFKLIKQLKAEAKRQKDIKEAKLTYAASPIEEVPVDPLDQEISDLADGMEVFEEDDE